MGASLSLSTHVTGEVSVRMELAWVLNYACQPFLTRQAEKMLRNDWLSKYERPLRHFGLLYDDLTPVLA